MKCGLSQNKQEILKNFFDKFPEVEKVFIYGSRVKGNHSNASDIDLGIKFKDSQTDSIAKIKATAEDLPILNEISLVDEDKIEEGEFKKEYEKTKRLFYSKK